MDWKTCHFKLAWIVERTITTTPMEMFIVLHDMADKHELNFIIVHETALSFLNEDELSD